MPYCTDCERFYNPNTLSTGGECPQGHHVADPAAPPTNASTSGAGASGVGPLLHDGPLPWHFKLLVALTVLYLGWRVVELVWMFF